MIKSMTGYGQSSFKQKSHQINLEIRTVNSRFLDYKIRGYSINPNVEKKIRELLELNIIRGNIQIKIEMNSNELNNLTFNKERFDTLMEVIKKVYVDYGQRISLGDVINTNDILMNNDRLEIDQNLIIKAVQEALTEVNQMRNDEGNKIKIDILKRIDDLQKNLIKIKKISGSFSQKKEDELRNKIESLLENKEIDESRLLQEVAYLAEKVDITEELTRCIIHFEQLLLYFEKDEPVGKKINFLLQEINREINTIGSKSPQTEVTFYIVEMKGELEKIREQVQNIL